MPNKPKSRRLIAASFLLAASLFSDACFSSTAAAADKIRLGALKAGSAAPIFIAQQKGYFAKEGLEAEIVPTEQPQFLSQGVLSGDLDFAVVGVISAFFNVAGQGGIRIIAGNVTEAPTFEGLAIVASNQAYGAGLTSFRDLQNHSYAIVSAGGIGQYDIAMLADKYRFDYRGLRIVQLGSYPNVASAVIGGTADAAAVPAAFALQPAESGKLHNLGWVGDQLQMTVAVVVTSGKIADTKPDLVQRFLRAYRAAVQEYRDAFSGPDERFRETEKAPEIYAILSKYLGEPVESIKVGLPHIDADARVDVRDLARQIAWYKSQGMVKPDVDGSKIIDTRYAIPLTDK